MSTKPEQARLDKPEATTKGEKIMKNLALICLLAATQPAALSQAKAGHASSDIKDEQAGNFDNSHSHYQRHHTLPMSALNPGGQPQMQQRSGNNAPNSGLRNGPDGESYKAPKALPAVVTADHFAKSSRQHIRKF
jgi:hypothetical protein